MQEKDEDQGPLLNESADRALQLIIYLRDTGAISVTEAAEHLGIAPSTAHRLLTTLVQRHFAEQMTNRKYRPGREIANAEPVSVARLREAARPAMASLAQALGETVQLVVLRGGNIEFVDGVESENLLRVSCRFGVQIPAFTSAGGQALLAEMSDAQIQELYPHGVPTWPTSSIGTIDDLNASLDETRRTGSGTNFEESERGIIGLGAAIHNIRDEAVGALTVAIPASRFQPSKMPRILEDLTKATKQIGELLGEQSS